MDVFDFHERRERRADEETEKLAGEVIAAAIEVHRHLGPGLPEISYRRAMARELTLRGIEHECEFKLPILYKGELVGEGRVDILVGRRLVLEIKVVEVVTKVHVAQTIAYLQALKLEAWPHPQLQRRHHARRNPACDQHLLIPSWLPSRLCAFVVLTKLSRTRFDFTTRLTP
jgi:GxxExxY protein